jgi:hypothetical protein
MIDISKITAEASFLYYGEQFKHLEAPEKVDILEYNNGYNGHSMLEYTTKTEHHWYPIISSSKELRYEINKQIW